MRTNPCEDFFGLKRLREVVDSPGAETFDHVVRLALGCDENDGSAFVAIKRVQATAGLESINPGHHDVEQHEVRKELSIGIKCFFARIGIGQRVAFSA